MELGAFSIQCTISIKSYLGQSRFYVQAGLFFYFFFISTYQDGFYYLFFIRNNFAVPFSVFCYCINIGIRAFFRLKFMSFENFFTDKKKLSCLQKNRYASKYYLRLQKNIVNDRYVTNLVMKSYKYIKNSKSQYES